MTSDSFSAVEGAASGGGGGGNSYSQRSSLPSPWAQVVRGGGSEPDPAASRSPTESPSSVLTEQNVEFSDQLPVMELQTVAAVEKQPEGSESSNDGGNASGVMKSAWNIPSANDGNEGSNTPVMGAASWPALSELNRPLSKSPAFPSEPSSNPTSDGSVVSQAPASLPQPQRPIRNNGNHNPNQNHTHTGRPRSMRRGGGGGGYNRSQPPTPPPMPPPMPPLNPFYNMPYRGFVPGVVDSSVMEQSPYNGNNSFAPRPMGGVDHSSNRRRNNFGPRPRGDGGSYLNNGHGGRRDHHDREWRGPRSMPPQMVPLPPPLPRGLMPPGHMGPAPFMAPVPLRPYGSPIPYDMTSPYPYYSPVPLDPYRGAPLPPCAVSPPPIRTASPPPFIDPPATIVDTPLPVKIRNQIEFYFSDGNLVRDEYLRSYMDEEGWVPITLIAGFRRVQLLTSDIPLILNCLRDSTIVEVQGETLRRRNDWVKYLKPVDSSTQLRYTAIGSLAEETSTSMMNLSFDDLTTANMSIMDENNTHNDVEFTDSSKLAIKEVTTSDVSVTQ